jgi:Low-density lipoprotein receptor domain class A.
MALLIPITFDSVKTKPFDVFSGFQSCRQDEFKCHNGTCLNISKRCNNVTDCATGEDERNCPQGEYENSFIENKYLRSSQSKLEKFNIADVNFVKVCLHIVDRPSIDD